LSISIGIEYSILYITVMPIDQGTLQGYDQLLSISQEVINRQLVTLYHTPVHPPINNGPKFLINHELNFHPFVQNKSGKKVPGGMALMDLFVVPRLNSVETPSKTQPTTFALLSSRSSSAVLMMARFPTRILRKGDHATACSSIR
jgi:hypothetical protein